MFIFIKPDILVFVKTVHIFICLRCISIDYQRQFTKVERRRQEVEGLLRERGEGWRSRGRSEETLYESLSYRELQGEQVETISLIIFMLIITIAIVTVTTGMPWANKVVHTPSTRFQYFNEKPTSIWG